MDESHRLKAMPPNYDRALFNQLFKETKSLRHKLAWDIDPRKFGISYEDMVSAFDVKFVYAFTKYYGSPQLKGYIIRALQTYKMRVIKNAYLDKQKIFDSEDITGLYNYDSLVIENPYEDNQEQLIQTIKNYLKARLSSNAYLVFEIDLNPPPYIIKKLRDPEKIKMPKCPADLVAEYLGIDNEPEAISNIKAWRKEIKEVINQAREYYAMGSVSKSLLASQ